ncbi:MAG TPA: AraC family transcriptional regulator [Candidatus Gemmiger excrementavium]|uniref:AraC family transcriptional regulator n=1 Tax=Candidatus Gemmiger excrementavium TaxID=2838608 RepID=A0A9D2JF69_9FIRM|nr:AraC family transcriptional regulator [Candidatus Gemmiger excrementavium]
MDERLLAQLRRITEEEQAILDGQGVQRERYTSGRDFVVDSEKLLEKGKLIEIRPHTRFVHFPRHRHNYVELLYMCSGTTTHILNGTQKLVLRQGDLLFLNQAVYHEILPAAEGDVGVNFILLPQFFDRSFRMLEQENVLRDFLISTLAGESAFAGWLHIAAGDILPVENLLENMIWTLLEKKPGVNLLNQTTMGLLLQNLTLFAENINRTLPDSREENAVFTTLQYIETRYRDGTLEEIAARLHMPPYALSRLLTRHTGANFKQLLQQRKLQQAVYLLSHTGMSADAVLEAIGYENSSYFYRKFKEKYGCTPAAYRAGRRL